MKEKQSSNKTWIILIVIIATVLAIYFYSAGKPSDPSSALDSNSPDTSEAQISGARILVLLNQIRSLNIDQSFFASPAFTSLTDYTIAIPDQNIGRSNPFAPI